MKIELSENQVSLILESLSALSKAAEYENRATNDPDIHESNDAAIKAATDLYEYITNYPDRG